MREAACTPKCWLTICQPTLHNILESLNLQNESNLLPLLFPYLFMGDTTMLLVAMAVLCGESMTQEEHKRFLNSDVKPGPSAYEATVLSAS